jgi:hypothetical protein
MKRPQMSTGKAGQRMRAQAEQRLSELRAEHQKGQQMLADAEAKAADLRQTLLRITGAIQVLEELMADSSERQNGAEPATAAEPAHAAPSVTN